MDLLEGVGESSSPPRSFGSCAVLYDIKNDVYNRLVQSGNAEAVTNPELLREQLDSHFARLPARFHFLCFSIFPFFAKICITFTCTVKLNTIFQAEFSVQFHLFSGV